MYNYQIRVSLIKSWHRSLVSSVYRTSVLTNERVKSFNAYVLDPCRPNYAYRSPSIDYKKQRARGTLIEGVDYYLPTESVQNRLINFFEPYSAGESESRRSYRYQNLKLYIGVAIGVSLVHGWLQRRPVAWCLTMTPPEPPNYPFWFKSPLHSHDIASVRRGYEVYRQVCSTCHSMIYLSFRHLANEVYPEGRVKQIAGEYEVEDDPDEKGEVLLRPGEITDKFPVPYPNIEAARYANNGANPPDLSLMASARTGGPDYLFSLLTGYTDPPKGIKLRQGLYFNNYFLGGSISMPPPLEEGIIDYEDGTPATVPQMAKDVANFITWASDPMHDERKHTCLKLLVGVTLGSISVTLWHRFFWAFLATSRIDFNKIKYLR